MKSNASDDVRAPDSVKKEALLPGFKIRNKSIFLIKSLFHGIILQHKVKSIIQKTFSYLLLRKVKG